MTNNNINMKLVYAASLGCEKNVQLELRRLHIDRLFSSQRFSQNYFILIPKMLHNTDI